MATVIRFSRRGTKKKPYFRIVVQDKQFPRDGRFIDHIGSFDPLKGDKSVTVSRERLEYWLSTGAQLSTSVKNRLKAVRREWAKGAAAPEAGSAVTAPAEPKKPRAKKAESVKEA